MVNVIKLRKGLDIRMKGRAAKKKASSLPSADYGLVPSAFDGVVPKVVVREGDSVKAGDFLFVNKHCPEVGFASPVSGTVTAVVRGERRKVLCVKVKPSKKQTYAAFEAMDPASLNGATVVQSLLRAGLFGYINKLPYAISALPTEQPKAIFVSALRDMPLSADFEYELEGNEIDFQAGLTALSKVAKTHLGIGKKQTAKALTEARDVEITVFDGPCPAGNVGVQVNHIDPVNKGEVVWTVDPASVIFFGRLLRTGKVDLHRLVAVAGSEVSEPCYVETMVGAQVATVITGHVESKDGVRLIDGNPLTGSLTTPEGYIGGHTSEITAIPEGDHTDEMLGWIMPRIKTFSTSRSYLSWLLGKKKEYVFDARIKGGERHIIMSGEYDKMVPMDICCEYLIKAIIAGDIDKMEALGIYEVSPEDFALAEFVDSSKLELQKIVRKGLDLVRSEV